MGVPAVGPILLLTLVSVATHCIIVATCHYYHSPSCPAAPPPATFCHAGATAHVTFLPTPMTSLPRRRCPSSTTARLPTVLPRRLLPTRPLPSIHLSVAVFHALTFTILPSTISPSSNHRVPATALSIMMASAHGMLLLYPPRIYSPLSALDIRPCPCQRCEEQSALSFNPHHPFTPVYAGVHLEEIEVFTHRD
ncbi:hypothetical protein B0H10DRAFT_2440077 [Mycena sp. CBHHK59/15]|nr:hypothetical protein B0H10DRAFT_2440077 [Mycena sp. CBHHK59/15]